MIQRGLELEDALLQHLVGDGRRIPAVWGDGSVRAQTGLQQCM
jgi:hypothetical protein